MKKRKAMLLMETELKRAEIEKRLSRKNDTSFLNSAYEDDNTIGMVSEEASGDVGYTHRHQYSNRYKNERIFS